MSETTGPTLATDVVATIYSLAEVERSEVLAKLRPTTLEGVVDVTAWLEAERYLNPRLDFAEWRRPRRRAARRMAHALSRIHNLPRPADDTAAAAILIVFLESLYARRSFIANNDRLAGAAEDMERAFGLTS